MLPEADAYCPECGTYAIEHPDNKCLRRWVWKIKKIYIRPYVSVTAWKIAGPMLEEMLAAKAISINLLSNYHCIHVFYRHETTYPLGPLAIVQAWIVWRYLDALV